VYRKIGGHNYPWVYSGPIGAIITPQFHGVLEDPWLPYASSLCGACAEVCPVKIDIPRLLLELRSEVVQARKWKGSTRVEQAAFRAFAWIASHPRIYARLGALAAFMAPRGESGWLRRLPFFMKFGALQKWVSQRDFPAPAARSFRQYWRTRPKERGD
jgi:L-lactate dehydrogenase complex protein LldF